MLVVLVAMLVLLEAISVVLVAMLVLLVDMSVVFFDIFAAFVLREPAILAPSINKSVPFLMFKFVFSPEGFCA